MLAVMPCNRFTKMYTSSKKIHKDKDVEPTEFEETVAQSLFDLESTNQELKGDLKDLYINQAFCHSVALHVHVHHRRIRHRQPFSSASAIAITLFRLRRRSPPPSTVSSSHATAAVSSPPLATELVGPDQLQNNIER
ncbi:hypothetical protein RJT34_24676 [Clitoria ternatea]|uniref:40S ribosomal protein S7 n=1 Tax=Clitoria ternatea TaxID=43366 RepID=A0AAN9FR40_CLITE